MYRALESDIETAFEGHSGPGYWTCGPLTGSSGISGGLLEMERGGRSGKAPGVMPPKL